MRSSMQPRHAMQQYMDHGNMSWNCKSNTKSIIKKTRFFFYLGIYGLTEIFIIIIFIMNQMIENEWRWQRSDKPDPCHGHQRWQTWSDAAWPPRFLSKCGFGCRPSSDCSAFCPSCCLLPWWSTALSLSLNHSVNIRLSWSLRLCQCDLHCSPKSSDSS